MCIGHGIHVAACTYVTFVKGAFEMLVVIIIILLLLLLFIYFFYPRYLFPREV